MSLIHLINPLTDSRIDLVNDTKQIFNGSHHDHKRSQDHKKITKELYTNTHNIHYSILYKLFFPSITFYL